MQFSNSNITPVTTPALVWANVPYRGTLTPYQSDAVNRILTSPHFIGNVVNIEKNKYRIPIHSRNCFEFDFSNLRRIHVGNDHAALEALGLYLRCITKYNDGTSMPDAFLRCCPKCFLRASTAVIQTLFHL